jgi:hypothetical protein
LLRAATLHLIATLRGAEKPESALSIEDRKTRVRALAAPALDFAAEERNQEPAGPACEQAISRRLDAWRANPNAQTADAAVEALDGMFANVILSRLRTWKALRLAEQEQRRQAVVLQAEMRQIFYIIYPRAFERDREGAWKTLTEFTNDPKQMDAAFIAKTVKTDFADALASVRGESRE